MDIKKHKIIKGLISMDTFLEKKLYEYYSVNKIRPLQIAGLININTILEDQTRLIR